MPKTDITLDELQRSFVEIASGIIRDYDIAADFYRRNPDNRYNLRINTDDDGWFLILDGWGAADALSEELLNRYPCIAEEAGIDVVSYDNVLSELFFQCYGFADEYGYCDTCMSPLEFADGEYIDDYDAGERICFDCLDDDFYFEWLANEPDRANAKYNRGELEDRGWTLVAGDLRSTMHDMPSDDPRQMLEAALEDDPDGEYIFSLKHPYSRDPFTVEFEMYKR